MGHAADPEEAGEAGRARHGADLRRAHERHQLRRLHPARRARILYRRAAGAGAERRPASRSMSRRARIDLEVPEDELARRRAAWTPPAPRYERGYGWMFTRHIQQANEGCDFDFLRDRLRRAGRRSRRFTELRSFRGARSANPNVQLHIVEPRGCGFDASHRRGMTNERPARNVGEKASQGRTTK